MDNAVLVVAAHPDDEVLGCGGTIAKLAQKGHSVHILILAEGITSREVSRDRDSKREELNDLAVIAEKSAKILGAKSIQLKSFPDNRMDGVEQLEVVKVIEQIIDDMKPHTVLTHHCGDVNVDHRVVHQSVITACRPTPAQCVKRILAFEVPSSTEWQVNAGFSPFQPNWFETIDSVFDVKIEALKIYQKEMRSWPHPRSFEAVSHLAKWRGATVGVNYAESFILLRHVE